MIESDKLALVITAQQMLFKTDLGIARDSKIKPLRKFVLIVSGVRRCGKSTLIKQHLQKRKPVYFLHFEDVRLATFEQSDFSKLDDLFESQLGKGGIYFFDEIQNVIGWEIYVRQLVDRGAEVYITGSNAKLMSTDLATKLTGRNIRQELYPFSFNEFVRAKKVTISSSSFNEYLRKGGVPEYVMQDDKRILYAFLDDLIQKDVIVKNKLREELLVKQVVTYLLSNVSKLFSYTQIKNLFNAGSTNSIISIVDYLENSYLMFTLKKYSPSLKVQSRNEKKIYCIDTGVVSELAFKTSADTGRLLENAVFLKLKREGRELYYHKEKAECDFVVKDGVKITHAIQVCAKLNDDNKAREYAGLLEALDAYKLDEGIIVTLDQEDSITLNDKKIKIVAAWKWFNDYW